MSGGGGTPPRTHFRQSVIRKSHRRGSSGLRVSFSGPGWVCRAVCGAGRSQHQLRLAKRGREEEEEQEEEGAGRSRAGARRSEAATARPSGSPPPPRRRRDGLPRQLWSPPRGASTAPAAASRAAPTEHAQRWPSRRTEFRSEIPLLRVFAAAARGQAPRRGAGSSVGDIERRVSGRMGRRPGGGWGRIDEGLSGGTGGPQDPPYSFQCTWTEVTAGRRVTNFLGLPARIEYSVVFSAC